MTMYIIQSIYEIHIKYIIFISCYLKYSVVNINNLRTYGLDVDCKSWGENDKISKQICQDSCPNTIKTRLSENLTIAPLYIALFMLLKGQACIKIPININQRP